MSPIVREMAPADLEPLRWVIYRAYFQVLLDLYGRETATQYELRSLDFMALYLRRDPSGSFVAVTEDGGIAGGVFCFVWGEVGWFGSLAVAPEWQGHALGQRLTRRAVEYLKSRGCRRIGLETWPGAPLTRHLYTKLGFELGRSTVKLSRSVSPVPGGAGAGVAWAGAGARADLPAALDAAGRVVERMRSAAGPDEPRVDYTTEARVTASGGWGELAVERDGNGEPGAFALCLLKKPSGAAVPALDVRVLAVAPGRREAAALDAILAALDRRALALGCQSVTCDANLRHAHALDLLRRRGFRPVYELVRMELPTPAFDPAARSPLVEGARWAG